MILINLFYPDWIFLVLTISDTLFSHKRIRLSHSNTFQLVEFKCNLIQFKSLPIYFHSLSLPSSSSSPAPRHFQPQHKQLNYYAWPSTCLEYRYETMARRTKSLLQSIPRRQITQYVMWVEGLSILHKKNLISVPLLLLPLNRPSTWVFCNPSFRRKSSFTGGFLLPLSPFGSSAWLSIHKAIDGDVQCIKWVNVKIETVHVVSPLLLPLHRPLYHSKFIVLDILLWFSIKGSGPQRVMVCSDLITITVSFMKSTKGTTNHAGRMRQGRTGKEILKDSVFSRCLSFFSPFTAF